MTKVDWDSSRVQLNFHEFKLRNMEGWEIEIKMGKMRLKKNIDPIHSISRSVLLTYCSQYWEMNEMWDWRTYIWRTYVCICRWCQCHPLGVQQLLPWWAKWRHLHENEIWREEEAMVTPSWTSPPNKNITFKMSIDSLRVNLPWRSFLKKCWARKRTFTPRIPFRWTTRGRSGWTSEIVVNFRI